MERTIDKMSLDGGCACFDFTNTVHSRKEDTIHEYLKSYTDWLQWCRKTKLIEAERIGKLEALAFTRAKQAEEVLQRAKGIREMLYAVFSAIAAKERPEKMIMKQFNESIRKALVHLHLSYENGEKVLGWEQGTTSLEEPLWRILKSAFDLWTQEDIKRIKECESCGWLFLDTSKNNRRRWCNMQSCGSSDKALRYYYRKKKQRQQNTKK